jgi:hypothetical protein
MIKHWLKQSQMNFLVNKYQKQIASGLTPTQVKFSTLLPVLHDATVAGIVDAYDFMNIFTGCELVKRYEIFHALSFTFTVIQFPGAWEHCTAKEWNFLDQCLTSKKVHMALNECLHSHANLQEEIESCTRTVHGIEDVEAQTPSSEDSYDDTNVPSSVIIQNTLGIEVPDNVFEQICVGKAQKDDKHGVFVADGDDENIWAWNNGEKMG